MKVIINNNGNVPKKYLRYINWRLHRLKTKFADLGSAEVIFRKLGKSSELYNVHINLNANEQKLFVSKADSNLYNGGKLTPRMALMLTP